MTLVNLEEDFDTSSLIGVLFAKKKRVLSLIEGVRFEFTSTPRQTNFPKQIPTSVEGRRFMTEKITELLANGSIKRINYPHKKGWLSNVFLVPKKDGGFRMILNLKPLNKFIKYRKFKMDHINDVLKLVEKDMLLCSLNISNAFHNVFIAEEHQKFLTFQCNNNFYQFTCLAQGATCSPRIFVKLTTPLMKYLRAQMVSIVIYIDDTLILARCLSEMKKSMQMTIECLENAGFLINYSKSQTTPTKIIEFLGFMINTEHFEVSLTEVKLLSLRTCVEKALSCRKITIRFLSQIIGKIVSTFPCCDEAPLHYRTLDRFKVKSLHLSKQKWNSLITLSSQCLQELAWWKANADMKMMTKSLHAVDISEHVYTDSSAHSFGGWWKDRTIQSKI